VTIEFDDDLFDAEIKVERYGLGEFTRDDLAEFLGLSGHTVTKMLRRGNIPGPRRYGYDAVGNRVPMWSSAQVAQILVRRGRKADRCGTPAGKQAHRRAGTPICEPCRQAHNDYQRRRRQSKGLVNA
jgi:hypothetical protein